MGLNMKLLFAALVALLLFVVPALAEVATSPTTTTIVTSSAPPPVIIPWGDWLDAAIQQVVLPILATVVAGLVAWASTFLPASLRAFVNAKNTAAVEQLLVPAMATGLKKIGAEVAGKTLDVAVGSAVVAEATQYAITHGPGYLIKWAGGEEGIRQKIIARLPVAPGTATYPLPPVVTPHP